MTLTKGLSSKIKNILVFTAAIVMCAGLCYCGSKTEASPKENPLRDKSGNYTTTAQISYKELEATATITQETPKSCIMEFTSPPSLAEMSFVFREGVVDLGYKGLNFTFDPSTVPGGAVAKMTVAAINKAMKDDGLSIEYMDNMLRLDGVMDTGSFSLTLDSENGNLLKLSVPAEDLEIEFANFVFLE